LDNTIIKNVIEKNIKNSNNESQNEVQIVFETSQQGVSAEKTITLSGEGSVKVLMHV
jgi:hypothetical protein